MKRSVLLAPLALLFSPLLVAQSAPQPAATPPPISPALPRVVPPGPQVSQAPSQPQQRVYAPTADTLIARQTADGILEGFRNAYKADGAPRVVIYVNRALVDTSNGLKLTERTERFEKSDNSQKTSGTNSYKQKDGTAPTLADQQTVRDIERLFGRAFRHAGAQLADQRVATALLPEQAGAHLVGDNAEKDRKALSEIADIAIEVLISSRNITVPEVSGDVTYPVPDIQATAIRLKDAAIVGQAAASDIIGKGVHAGRVVRQFDVNDITEATAIALMEDMLTGKR
jgi:hypothetical protein